MTDAEFRKLRKRAGVCVQCGRDDAYTMGKRSLCERCAEMYRGYFSKYMLDNEKREKRSSMMRDTWDGRKLDGLCPRCGTRPSGNGYVLCSICRAKQRNYMRRYRNNPPRGEYGVCWTCNKNEVLQGKKLCQECYEKAVKNCEAATKARLEKQFHTLRATGAETTSSRTS